MLSSLVGIIFTLALLLAASPAWSVTCDYYAANNGTGNGLAAGTPFKISDFWALGQATIRGKTLCLNDGVYQGANNMIVPTTGINGASGQTVTIAAVNEGSVLIDGQYLRYPVALANNQYFRVEGVNACCSGTGRPVVSVIGDASHSWFKRIVAWDQLQTPDSGNAASIFSVQATADDILFEDVAGFGNAQRIGRCAFGATNVTFRRLYGRQDGPSAAGGPASLFNLVRNSGACTLENGILQWLGTTSGADEGRGIRDNTDSTSGTSKILGTLVMDKGVATGAADPSVLLWLGTSTFRQDPVTIADVVLYAPSASLPALGIDLRNCSDSGGAACVGNSVTRLTLISPEGQRGAGIGSQWNATNFCEATSFSGCNNIFNGANAANLCFRYENGVLGATPLWPWPMDSRINAAITATGKTALVGNSVTAEVEAIGAGDIPAACRTDSETSPFAEFTGFPTTSELTAFSGSASPPTGFTTLTGNGWTEAGGVATPISGFSVIQTSATYNADQEAWCVMTTLPTAGGTSGLGVDFLIKGATDRYLVNVFNVTGTDNDSLFIQRRTSTGTQTLATTQLGYDLATGDAVGVRVVDNAITGTIKRASEGVWRIIATATAANPGQNTSIGLGADVATCTSFGGGAIGGSGDTTAPTAPGNLTVTVNGAASLLADWDASTDAVGVTEYRVYRGLQSDCSDCTVTGTTTTETQYSDATATLGVSNYYKITALDAAGNESTASSVVGGRIPDGPGTTAGSGRAR